MSGSFLITGATGFIGSMVMKRILQSREYANGQTQIIVLVRSISKFRDMYRDYDCSKVVLIEGELCNKLPEKPIVQAIDYIIHCAAPTTSAYMITNPVETANDIVLGTQNILELAKKYKVKSMVYLSSMEVYGRVTDIGRTRTENELGEIDIENVRSCYPLGKRMAEHYCYIYAQQYGVPVKIARLAQTFGIGVRAEDHRVYMQFARSVIEKKDIILKTQGLSMGNYCATEDAVNAIFIILQKGVNGEAYNVVNEKNTMRIREMAQLVAEKIARGDIKVRVEIEDAQKTGYASDTDLRLSGNKLRQLGWQPTKGMIEMYQDVLEEID